MSDKLSQKKRLIVCRALIVVSGLLAVVGVLVGVSMANNGGTPYLGMAIIGGAFVGIMILMSLDNRPPSVRANDRYFLD